VPRLQFGTKVGSKKVRNLQRMVVSTVRSFLVSCVISRFRFWCHWGNQQASKFDTVGYLHRNSFFSLPALEAIIFCTVHAIRAPSPLINRIAALEWRRQASTRFSYQLGAC